MLWKFFGCQRQCGRTNENPQVAEFLKNIQSIIAIDSIREIHYWKLLGPQVEKL